ncbi:MAG: hypothetical protein WBG86_15985 [Polyangiales bacterium]
MSTMDDVAKALSAGGERQVYASAIGQMQNWKATKITTDEREDRIRVFRLHLNRIDGTIEPDECYREEARMTARWMLKAGAPLTRMPANDAWKKQIATYMQNASMLSEELSRRPGERSKPTIEQATAAKRETHNAFEHWWRPIHVAIKDAENAYAKLARFGYDSDSDMMLNVFDLGRSVSDAIQAHRDKQRVVWLPQFTDEPYGCDSWWRDELFGVRTGCKVFPDAIAFWIEFTKHHLGLIPRESALALEPTPEPYGNFGERDLDDEPPF